MSETKIYPFETKNLQKGDRISRETIERAYKVKAGTDSYNLAALKAKEFLLRSLRDRGRIVTVCQDHHDLVILSDEDASTYNDRSFSLAMGDARRSHGRMLAVDRSQLSDETRERHDRSLVVQGKQLQAVREARRLSAAPRKRETPALSPVQEAKPA